MSVTFARGFRAGAAAAGLKSTGALDVCVVANDGSDVAAAAVFTSNRVSAAPVRWSQRVLAEGDVRAVVLNSGGANACTGPEGAHDTAAMAQDTAQALHVPVDSVAVCSTGLIGVRLPMDRVSSGIATAVAALSDSAQAGIEAARAIMTTDSVPKTAVFQQVNGSGSDWRIGGMAKGAGMLAPGLATMLVVITTDARVDCAIAQAALEAACGQTFNRLDSDGCMSTNDTVLLMSSGLAGPVDADEFAHGLHQICRDLVRQLQHDAEGSTKDITIRVSGAASEPDAETAARAIARSALLKCAIHGEDPNWGRVLAALGTCDIDFDPDNVDVCLNGTKVCEASQAGAPRERVTWQGRDVTIEVDLHAGDCDAVVWTNDLTAMYVHENSAYSS